MSSSALPRYQSSTHIRVLCYHEPVVTSGWELSTWTELDTDVYEAEELLDFTVPRDITFGAFEEVVKNLCRFTRTFRMWTDYPDHIHGGYVEIGRPWPKTQRNRLYLHAPWTYEDGTINNEFQVLIQQNFDRPLCIWASHYPVVELPSVAGIVPPPILPDDHIVVVWHRWPGKPTLWTYAVQVKREGFSVNTMLDRVLDDLESCGDPIKCIDDLWVYKDTEWVLLLGNKFHTVRDFVGMSTIFLCLDEA